MAVESWPVPIVTELDADGTASAAAVPVEWNAVSATAVAWSTAIFLSDMRNVSNVPDGVILNALCVGAKGMTNASGAAVAVLNTVTSAMVMELWS